ncbi:hypothetical protein OHD50_16085 [Escherichia coli]|nr:hypothetical protein [Escherichia coli]
MIKQRIITASGVVPISINSVDTLGICSATLRAILSFLRSGWLAIILRRATELEGSATPP